MGAGVQTTACLILYIDKYDKVIFADTADEAPETYEYIRDYLQPYAGRRWVSVKSDRNDSLLKHCMDNKIIPLMTKRWCTTDFKIKPINKYLRTVLKATHKNPVYTHIGFSIDESHRANFSKKNPKYSILTYPLLDDEITRHQCYDIIKQHGWPVPPKSGCYYCPFMGKKRIRELKVSHPDLFEKVIQLEENDAKFPKRTLFGKGTVRGITAEDTMSLDDFEEFGCDSGHCML